MPISYPSEILPRRAFKPQIDIEQMIAEADCVIARRSSKSREEVFTDIGTIRSDVFHPNDGRRFSTNLLGGQLTIDHMGYSVKVNSGGGEKWDGTTDVQVDPFKNDFEYLEDVVAIGFNISALHNSLFPCKSPISKDSEKFIRTNSLQSASQNGSFIVAGTAKVEHDPLNLNYWHVEVVLYFNGKVMEKRQNKWEISGMEYFVDQLLTFHGFEITGNDFQAIKNHHFHRI